MYAANYICVDRWGVCTCRACSGVSLLMQYSRTLIFINTWSILHYFYDYITHGDGEFFITKYRLKCVVYYMWRRSVVLWCWLVLAAAVGKEHFEQKR